jgi:uncharacterized OB-fold protein
MAVETTLQRPLPVPDPVSQPFWDAARERRLAVQRCNACGTWSHPPVPLCSNCHSEDLGWAEVSGRGRVATLTVIRSSRVQGMEGRSIAVAGVELAEQEGLVLVGNVLDVAVDDVRIGLPVKVTFEDIGSGFVLPQFERAEED